MRATMERGWEVQKVVVRKADLLPRIKANLENHLTEYEAAKIGYREKVLKVLKDKIKEINAEDWEFQEVYGPGLIVPVSHEKDYRQIIDMLEMGVDETVELTSDQFACFARDDWSWKGQFTTTNRMYGVGLKK